MDDRDRRRLRWVRLRWSAEVDRDAARARVLARRHDPTTPAWLAILEGQHPFVASLTRDDDPPDILPDGTDLHQLLASHPFPDATPGSSPPTSDPSSWSDDEASLRPRDDTCP